MAGLLVVVIVAQMDFQSRDVIAESAFRYTTGLIDPRLVNLDVVAGVYLNCMVFSFCECDWFNIDRWRPVLSAQPSGRPEQL